MPDTGKPPVVFLNGYQAGCTDPVTFAGTFGIADQLLQRDSRVTLFFNNCNFPNQTIEDLGAAFGRFLDSLRYTDGRTIPQVDIVAHSMGGLILRCYLTGKGNQRGVFQPPGDSRIRKAVLLAVPFFGSYIADQQSDTQAVELRDGSPLIFDLATWNQGRDDMRGIDAVGVVANGGTGVLSSSPNFDDSTVSVTSASLEWYIPGRTRVVNYCHTALTGVFSIGCSGSALPVARMTSDQHDAAKIMLSFLASTDAWKTVGQAPADNQYLKDRGGIQMQFRNAQDQIISVISASAAGGSLNVRQNEVAWSENVPATSPLQVTAATGAGSVQASLPVAAGLTRAILVTVGGPRIDSVIPNFSDVTPRAVAPGSFISIYGASLSTSTQASTTTSYPTSLGGAQVLMANQGIALQYASSTQINAVVPDSATGLVRLTVRNANGERGINVFVEPAVPSLFSSAVNSTTNALVSSSAPARAGDYITLYLTGLGLTDRRSDGLDWARQQPQVTVGDKTCALQYAGRAPGYVGLDQINCQLAADTPAGGSVTVAVTSGARTSTIVIPVR